MPVEAKSEFLELPEKQRQQPWKIEDADERLRVYILLCACDVYETIMWDTRHRITMDHEPGFRELILKVSKDPRNLDEAVRNNEFYSMKVYNALRDAHVKGNLVALRTEEQLAASKPIDPSEITAESEKTRGGKLRESRRQRK